MNLFSFNSLDNKLAKHIPAFYKELLKHFLFVEEKIENPQNIREKRKQIIWGNKYIKCKKNKCLVKANSIIKWNYFYQ